MDVEYVSSGAVIDFAGRMTRRSDGRMNFFDLDHRSAMLTALDAVRRERL